MRDRLHQRIGGDNAHAKKIFWIPLCGMMLDTAVAARPATTN
jgi:hypothetical protein